MTPEVFDAILSDVVAGAPVRRALQDRGVNPNVFYPALDKDEELAKRYARASLSGADAVADQAFAIADDPAIDADQKRVMVDVRKWWLAKRMPKKYGDKLSLAGADGEGPVEIVATWRDK